MTTRRRNVVMSAFDFNTSGEFPQCTYHRRRRQLALDKLTPIESDAVNGFLCDMITTNPANQLKWGLSRCSDERHSTATQNKRNRQEGFNRSEGPARHLMDLIVKPKLHNRDGGRRRGCPRFR